MIPFIDLTRQHAALRADLLAAATRVIDSSQFVLGPEGRALEQELAAVCGVPRAEGTGVEERVEHDRISRIPGGAPT